MPPQIFFAVIVAILAGIFALRPSFLKYVAIRKLRVPDTSSITFWLLGLFLEL